MGSESSTLTHSNAAVIPDMIGMRRWNVYVCLVVAWFFGQIDTKNIHHMAKLGGPMSHPASFKVSAVD